MIITNSNINMKAKRSYNHLELKQSITLDERKQDALKVDISDEAKSLLEQAKEHKEEMEEKKEQDEQTSMQQSLSMTFEAQSSTSKLSSSNGYMAVNSKEDMKLQLLQKLFASILKKGKQKNHTSFKDTMKSLGTQLEQNKGITIGRTGTGNDDLLKALKSTTDVNLAPPVMNQTQMVRTNITSSFEIETENTAFQAMGMAQTADGRNLSFGVTVEMSRAFCAKYESFSQESYIKTDPLVINLDSNIASVSDMKFLFDLDGDGKEESMSFTDKGSGFLALDKNGDGKINDGSELFGTKSGDGFRDLSKYDEDGNGWIDEADNIFKDLKVWTKNDDGTDQLIDLKKANVGAIFLGSANTEFTLQNQAGNDKNAIVQKTGVYLKENGNVGTIQHVDLLI